MSSLLEVVRDLRPREVEEAMPDEVDRRESGVSDRRSSPSLSPWQDPKTWMTLFGLMLTTCTILLTVTIWIAGRMLDQITNINKNIGTLTLTTSNTNTAQGIKIENLLREQDHFRDEMRDQNAYNFNVNKAMTEMVTTMRLRGMPTPNIPEPPKLGGQ